MKTVAAESHAATERRSNKALKLTAKSAAFIRELEGLMCCVRGSLSPAFGCFALNLRDARDLSLGSGARLLTVQLTAHVTRHAAALPLILDIARRALNNSLRGGR